MDTRKRIIIALAAGGLLLVGLAGGFLLGTRLPAQAQAAPHYTVASDGSQSGKYCQIYEQTLANDLHISPSALEQANIDASGKVLDQMAADGKITAVERDQLKQMLKQVGNQPCLNLNSKTIASSLQSNPMVLQQVMGARTALVNAVAGALHITPAALESDLGHNQTVAQIAQAQHVKLSDVSAAYLGAAQTYLNQAASGGILTQDQSKAVLDMLTKAVNSGHYPLVDGGMSGLTAQP
ncbi:MAG: hypothetical protein OJF49_001182 [Ktedonobacterales bacterium]|jgi:hypothetical protein|nr:MAG: hypothetical protein OJF49_001182 [Ktedonobacterales bacterium]